MRLGQKEVRIVPLQTAHTTWNDDLAQAKRPQETENGYVYMEHGTTYGIWLRNHTDEANDVVIAIDGKEVGGWRLEGYQTATIERPVDDSGQFTFYELGSSEAQKVGLSSIARDSLGLVKVTFIPEKAKHPGIAIIDNQSYSGAKGGGSAMKGGDWQESFSSGSRGGGQGVDLNTRSAGGTGLSGRSNQVFGSAQPIDRDYERQVVINLRLVAKPNDEPRPLRAVNATVSNLVPPPVN